jgi:hypothetical protein
MLQPRQHDEKSVTSQPKLVGSEHNRNKAALDEALIWMFSDSEANHSHRPRMERQHARELTHLALSLYLT